MPSLKRSASSSKRLSAKSDEWILKDAIEFLFQIKAAQFAIKHPDFVAPSAEEFFFYVTRIEEPSSKKRACLSNRFNSFLCFLTPMFHDTHTCSSIISCLTIAIYALTLYTATGSYLKETPATAVLNRALQTLDASEIADSVRDPLANFVVSYMSYVPRQAIDKIVGVSKEFVRRTLVKLPNHVRAIMPALNSAEIGTEISSGLDKVYGSAPFFLQWKAPTAVLLTRCGLAPCRSMCDEIADFMETKKEATASNSTTANQEFLGF